MPYNVLKEQVTYTGILKNKVYVVFLDDGHGMGTPGKRTPYIKELGRQIKENEFNRAVVVLMATQLQKAGIKVHLTAPGDDDVPLKERTDYANKVYWSYCSKHGRNNVIAIFVSIHYNALDGSFAGSNPEGFSAHIYKGHSNKDAGYLGKCILKHLAKNTPQVNRGLIEQDLHVTRETDMPAVLTENGFMDNYKEALRMIDVNYQREVAEEHCLGIFDYFGIGIKPLIKEEDEMPEKAVVIYGEADYSTGRRLAERLNAGVFTRAQAEKFIVAKQIFVVGGSKEGLKGNNFVVLSGADYFETTQAVHNYLK